VVYYRFALYMPLSQYQAGSTVAGAASDPKYRYLRRSGPNARHWGSGGQGRRLVLLLGGWLLVSRAL
jgi:hypothetical protein